MGGMVNSVGIRRKCLTISKTLITKIWSGFYMIVIVGTIDELTDYFDTRFNDNFPG